MKNYEIRVIPKTDVDGNVYWTAFFPAIKECVGGGSTAEEAIAEANENLQFYLSYLESEKLALPEEYKENNFSGKIALRVGKSTHKILIDMAELEGISLNSFINNAIENYIGKKQYGIEISQTIEQIQELSQENNNLQKINYLGNQKIVEKLWEKSYQSQVWGGYDE